MLHLAHGVNFQSRFKLISIFLEQRYKAGHFFCPSFQDNQKYELTTSCRIWSINSVSYSFTLVALNLKIYKLITQTCCKPYPLSIRMLQCCGRAVSVECSIFTNALKRTRGKKGCNLHSLRGAKKLQKMLAVNHFEPRFYDSITFGRAATDLAGCLLVLLLPAGKWCRFAKTLGNLGNSSHCYHY